MIELYFFFRNNLEEIFKEKFHLEKNGRKHTYNIDIRHFVKKSQNLYRGLFKNLQKEHERIKYLKESNCYTVIDYLKQYFVWEKYLLNAFLAITIKKKNEFESYEINVIPKSAVRTYIKYLKENGYIQHINTIKGRKIYKITNTGLSIAEKIEKNIRSFDTNLLNELKRKITQKLRIKHLDLYFLLADF